PPACFLLSPPPCHGRLDETNSDLSSLGWRMMASRPHAKPHCLLHEAVRQPCTAVLPDGIGAPSVSPISARSRSVCSPSTAIVLAGAVSAPDIRNGRFRTWNEPPSSSTDESARRCASCGSASAPAPLRYAEAA